MPSSFLGRSRNGPKKELHQLHVVSNIHQVVREAPDSNSPSHLTLHPCKEILVLKGEAGSESLDHAHKSPI